MPETCRTRYQTGNPTAKTLDIPSTCIKTKDWPYFSSQKIFGSSRCFSLQKGLINRAGDESLDLPSAFECGVPCGVLHQPGGEAAHLTGRDWDFNVGCGLGFHSVVPLIIGGRILLISSIDWRNNIRFFPIVSWPNDSAEAAEASETSPQSAIPRLVRWHQPRDGYAERRDCGHPPFPDTKDHIVEYVRETLH